ncbi:MAG: hypothetical protein ACLQVG_26605 [Terriglobia bacterium]
MAEWFRHKRHGFYILWSIGILALGAFQLPFLLANAGARFTLTTFNVFYAITAPLSFLGLLLIYAGLLPISSFKGRLRINIALTLWFLASVAITAYIFLTEGGYFTNHAIQVLPPLLFFLPLQLLIFFTLYNLLQRPWAQNPWCAAGIITQLCAVGLSLVLAAVAVREVLLYPPQFWFTAVGFNSPIYLLEGGSVLLLLIGFLMVHTHYRKIKDAGNDKRKPQLT